MICFFIKNLISKMKSTKTLGVAKENGVIAAHEQIEIIKKYVQIDTNYALIIDGVNRLD